MSAAGRPSPWDSRRLWSLWEMIDWSLHSFVCSLEILAQETTVAAHRAREVPNATLGIPDRERLEANLKFVVRECRRLSLGNAENRLDRLFTHLRLGNPPYALLANELNVLAEAIDDDIKFVYFYHYPRPKASVFLRISADWAGTIAAFPSVKQEIDDAVDCYALGHSTAAIFHLMRVAEYGLRALARERGVKLKNKDIEWGSWQDLITAIDHEARAIGKTTAAGAGKDAALDFYNGALGHFYAFKDQYRNMVSHVRRRYEPLEAEIAMNHVRNFMNGLSLKVNEKTKGPIRWKF